MEKLEIEFRYADKKDSWEDSRPVSSFFFVGGYETIEEAVMKGNEVLKKLAARGFEIRANDKFKVNGLFGFPDRLVSNISYKDKISFFAKITNVGFDNLDSMIDNAEEARKRYDSFRAAEVD